MSKPGCCNFFVKKTPPFKEPAPPRLPKLTARQEEMIAERRAQVYQLGRDAVGFVAELHKEGLIDGWRSVGEVKFFNEGEKHGTA